MKAAVFFPAAALLLASGCADTGSLLGPATTLSSFSTDDIPAPDVDVVVTGSDVEFSWTWSDATAWELVSFKIVDEDGVIPTVDAIPNAKPYAADALLERSHTFDGLAHGDYTFCVEVMAKDFTAPALTHHARSCESFTVGAPAYSVVVVGGSGADGTFNANANNVTLGYVLMLGNSVVVDCTVVPGVAGAAVSTHNCNSTTGERNLVMDNPSKGTGTTFTVQWQLPVPTVIGSHQLSSE